MSDKQINILKRALDRERAARKEAERILEEKSGELYQATQELERTNKQLQASITEKNSQLQGIFSNIVDPYVVMDLAGNVLRMNRSAEQMLGFTVEEDRRNLISLVHPEDIAHTLASFQLMLDEGKVQNFETRFLRADGSIRWVQINASLIYDFSRKPVAAQGIARDVTEERELQMMSDLINDVAKAILGETDLSRIAWQIVNHIAVYLNTDDCVIYLVDWDKEQLEQIAAYGNKVIPGEQEVLNRLIIPIDRGVVGEVARTGKSELIANASSDTRYIADDEIRLSEIAVPVISKGKVIAVIDSEHLQENFYTQEQLSTLQKVASVVSVQLESALNLESLRRAQKENQALLEKLELSNSELEEYAHIVSHDLKSPLRNIHALVEWIKEDNKEKLDSNTKENLGMIEDTLQKMEGLISGILSFSSINEESLHLVKTDLSKVVNDAIGLIHVPAHVTIQVAENLPEVIGDKLRLMQLYQNLIGNSVRYADKEESLVEVGYKKIEENTVYYVRDNGVGIDPAHHERIFKIFQSLSDKQESTGIGLSIVKKIIDLHKGDIWLESEVGSGTTFYFTLN